MWHHPYTPLLSNRPPRSMIRPVIIVGAERTGSWDVSTGAVSGSGTTYSAWVSLTDSTPTAVGYFSLPSSRVVLNDNGSATVYLELGSGDAEWASGIVLHSLRSSGDTGFSTTSACPTPTMLTLTYNRPLTQLRWAIVSDVQMVWSQTDSTLYKL